MEISILLAVSLFSVVIFYFYCKESLFSLLSLFLLFNLLLYVFIPFLDVIVFGNSISELYPLVILVSVFSLSLGVFFGRKINVIRSGVLTRLSYKKEKLVLSVMLFVSIVSLFTYVYSFGGLMSALIDGAKLRYSGESITLGKWGILLYFISCSKIVTCVSLYRILDKSLFYNMYIKLFLAGNAVILFYSLIKASRGAIVLTALMYIYVYFFHYSRQKEAKAGRKIILSSAFILPFLFIFIVYGKVLILNTAKYVETGTFDFSFQKYEGKRNAAGERFVAEFSHPYESLNYLLEHDVEINFFEHFFTAPFSLIPSKIFGIAKLSRISEENSKNISGDRNAGRPPGLIASFWYGGGVYAISFSLFIYGAFLIYLQKNAESMIGKNVLLAPYVAFIYFTIPWHSNNGDPSIILKSNVYLILFFLVLYTILTFRWGKR